MFRLFHARNDAGPHTEEDSGEHTYGRSHRDRRTGRHVRHVRRNKYEQAEERCSDRHADCRPNQDSAHEISLRPGRRSLIRQEFGIESYRLLVDFDAPIAARDLFGLAALVVAIARDRSTLGTNEMGPAGGVATVGGTLGRVCGLCGGGQIGVLANCLI